MADAAVALAGVTATSTSETYDTSQADYCRIHIYSAAGSTSTVLIENANLSAGPWYASATITNPSATGEAWAAPAPMPYTRVRCSAYTSGTITATITWGRNNQQLKTA